jgi:hypothetical protein
MRGRNEMAEKTVSLTIEGEPGAEVEVVYRDRGDEPPPSAYTGKLGPDGRVTVSLPRGYFLVFSPECEMAILHLETGPATQSVRLRKVKS